MTNGELFIKENPTVVTKINGSCVWIYFYDYNHYTMPIEWWDKEIDLFDKIRAEIEALPKTYPFINHIDTYVKEDDVKRIIDKYKESEVSDAE